jgi:plastocyanin
MSRLLSMGLPVAVMTAVIAFTTGTFAGDPDMIVQSERAFHPAEITINRGSTLNFSNRDEFIHQIYVDSGGFKYDSEEQPPGQTLKIIFPDSGTFPVRCHIHPKMLLTVHVK